MNEMQLVRWISGLNTFAEIMMQVCDEACNHSYGCWGKGPTMCVKCADYDMGNRCATICPAEG